MPVGPVSSGGPGHDRERKWGSIHQPDHRWSGSAATLYANPRRPFEQEQAMARVVHFEITADNPERAVKFYAQALGWKIERFGDEKYWLVGTGPADARGIDGAIMPREKPAENTVVTVGVGNLEAAMEAVRRAGGTADGSVDLIPDIGRFTYATDTEGNRFGLLEPLPGM
jgi:predicted enzyme related to lactoylglutathione lyase